MAYKFILWLTALVSVNAWAQSEPIQVLDTVYLSDANLKTFNTGQQHIQLSDSVLRHQNFALTDVLQRHTPIYFRQNGYGMVASASFRGTTAAQTAVLWNGININSALTGQTDFNTLLSANFSSIDVKFGGGSIIYGTGAIGGSIHLNQNLSKHIEEQHQFQAAYGSFNTFETRYAYQTQWDQLKLKLAYARRQSDNDYEIPAQNRDNQNGQFAMNSLDAVVRVDLSDDDVLSYFSNFSFGERHFSLIRSSNPRSKYDNVDTRNMIEWQSSFDQFQSKLKVAYLTEAFTYFDNLARNTASSAEVATQVLQYELLYNINTIKLKAILNYQNAQGSGDQLENAERDVAGLSLLFQQELNDQWNYEVSIRQDINDNFDNPFLLSLGSRYKLNDRWALRAHASRNYRLPTFNDLFWVNGGRTDLSPETAYQTEIGGTYDHQQVKVAVSGFYNDITDMIRWVPDAFGIWRPQNTDEVRTYGIESSIRKRYDINAQSALEFSGRYAYTISEDQQTGNQLIYVPQHLANAQLSYRHSRWSAGLFWRYTGEVFTRSDNDPNEIIADYPLVDLQMSYRLPKLFNSRLSLRAHNVFDTDYVVVENRPMPGQNISIQLLTTF